MKLLLKRNTSSSMMGKSVYTLDVRAEISPEDLKVIKDNGLTNELLVFHDKTGPTEGITGAVYSMMKNTALTVSTLITGTQFKCKNVGELLGIEEEVRAASVNLKRYIEVARQFGGEEVLDVDELAAEAD